ncbi:unnamed protein product [Arctia plantaginis]|uniref:Uncharacterized protein n=1 Tax=Arctia plantaginis TaxID=874455 RepID=A0A8S0ZPC0_ARCPL|nr:unnamed protein product [Arctia plantaginis]
MDSKLNFKPKKNKKLSSEKFIERQRPLDHIDSKIKTIRDSQGSVSSGSSELCIVAKSEVFTIPQEHGRTKAKLYAQAIISPTRSIVDVTGSISLTSISSSITRLRLDFDEFKCKMKIFGESLNLCKCIASDFKNKMKWMEKRLDNLEKRHKLTKVRILVKKNY